MISVQPTSVFRVMIAAALVFALPLAASAGPAPADKCEASKNKAAGAYYSCREKAEATAIIKASPPDYTKCAAKFDTSWDKAETTGAGACPDTVLTAPVNAYLAAQATEAASVIAGASIPSCAASFSTACDDLATCEAMPRLLSTGQTVCYDSSSTIPCAGTGQDGELQNGAARSFTSNGDGTITDNITGLMWEKLSDDGTTHDKDSVYSWAGAFAKVATLNSGGGFAGHNDWRLPNLFELFSLVNLQNSGMAVPNQFQSSCSASCTVLTCSCNAPTNYWTSSNLRSVPSSAWYVGLYSGGGVTGTATKSTANAVRAVRGGS